MKEDRISALHRMLATRPADQRLRFGLALEYEKLGRHEDVVIHLRDYLAGTDDQGNAWGRLAHALRVLGRYAEARDALRRGADAARRHGHPSMAAEFQGMLDEME